MLQSKVNKTSYNCYTQNMLAHVSFIISNRVYISFEQVVNTRSSTTGNDLRAMQNNGKNQIIRENY